MSSSQGPKWQRRAEPPQQAKSAFYSGPPLRCHKRWVLSAFLYNLPISFANEKELRRIYGNRNKKANSAFSEIGK